VSKEEKEVEGDGGREMEGGREEGEEEGIRCAHKTSLQKGLCSSKGLLLVLIDRLVGPDTGDLVGTHLLINIRDVCLCVFHLNQPLLSILALDPIPICEGACGTHVEGNLVEEWRGRYVEGEARGGGGMWRGRYVEGEVCGGGGVWRGRYVEGEVCGSKRRGGVWRGK